MIKTAIKIIFVFQLVFLLPCLLLDKSEASTEIQEYIIERINNIRLDPLSYAEGLGYDSQVLLDTLPFLNKFIGKDAELLKADKFLILRAHAQNSLDILESDPLQPNPVILPGNDYAYTGETKASVSFSNFMDMETALQVVVDNLFERELDPEFEGQKYILSSYFDLAGASLRSGTTWDQTGRKNSCFITICFGSSLLKSEVQVLNMINQVRAEPRKANNYILFNLNSLIQENFDVIHAFLGTYKPLFLDKTLQKKYGTLFNNTTTDYLSQALTYGYTGVEVNKSSTIEIFPKTDSNSFAILIFSYLILDELKAYPEKKIIFNPDFNDAGLAVFYINGAIYDFAKLTVTAGNTIKENSSCSKIYGLIYNDIDGNGVYAPGEGAAGQTVVVYNKETFEKVETAITDNAGHFSTSLLNQKEYIIETGTGETKAGKDIYLDMDQFFELNISSPELYY